MWLLLKLVAPVVVGGANLWHSCRQERGRCIILPLSMCCLLNPSALLKPCQPSFTPNNQQPVYHTLVHSPTHLHVNTQAKLLDLNPPTPSLHGRYFATASRDHTVKLWAMDPQCGPSSSPACTLPPFPCPVTAVALAPAHVRRAAAAPGRPDPYLCAVGLEDGGLQLWCVSPRQGEAGSRAAAGSSSGSVGGGSGEAAGSSGSGEGGEARLLWVAEEGCAHAAAVRRIAWAPQRAAGACAGGGGALVATCGEDHSVRVFEMEPEVR